MVNHTALNQIAFQSYQQWVIDHNGSVTDQNAVGSATSCPWPEESPMATTIMPEVVTTNTSLNIVERVSFQSCDRDFLYKIRCFIFNFCFWFNQLDGPFVWEEYAQTVIISSFYGGYLWSQLFGGRISEHVGGKRVIAFATLTGGILHFLVPLAASTHIKLLIFQRFLSGLSLVSIVLFVFHFINYIHLL